MSYKQFMRKSLQQQQQRKPTVVPGNVFETTRYNGLGIYTYDGIIHTGTWNELLTKSAPAVEEELRRIMPFTSKQDDAALRKMPLNEDEDEDKDLSGSDAGSDPDEAETFSDARDESEDPIATPEPAQQIVVSPESQPQVVVPPVADPAPQPQADESSPASDPVSPPQVEASPAPQPQVDESSPALQSQAEASPAPQAEPEPRVEADLVDEEVQPQINPDPPTAPARKSKRIAASLKAEPAKPKAPAARKNAQQPKAPAARKNAAEAKPVDVLKPAPEAKPLAAPKPAPQVQTDDEEEDMFGPDPLKFPYIPRPPQPEQFLLTTSFRTEVPIAFLRDTLWVGMNLYGSITVFQARATILQPLEFDIYPIEMGQGFEPNYVRVDTAAGSLSSLARLAADEYTKNARIVDSITFTQFQDREQHALRGIISVVKDMLQEIVLLLANDDVGDFQDSAVEMLDRAEASLGRVPSDVFFNYANSDVASGDFVDKTTVALATRAVAFKKQAEDAIALFKLNTSRNEFTVKSTYQGRRFGANPPRRFKNLAEPYGVSSPFAACRIVLLSALAAACDHMKVLLPIIFAQEMSIPLAQRTAEGSSLLAYLMSVQTLQKKKEQEEDDDVFLADNVPQATILTSAWVQAALLPSFLLAKGIARHYERNFAAGRSSVTLVSNLDSAQALIQEVETLRTNLQEEAVGYRNQMDEREDRAMREIESVKESTRQEIADLSAENIHRGELIQAAREETRAQKVVQERELDEIKAVYRRHTDKMDQQLQELHTQLALSREQNAQSEPRTPSIDQLASAQNQLAATEATLRQRDKDITEMQAQAVVDSNAIRELRSSVGEWRGRYDDLSNTLRAAQDKYAIAETERQRVVDKYANDFKSARQQIEQSEKKLADERTASINDIDNLTRRIERSEKALADQTARSTQQERELSAARDMIAALQTRPPVVAGGISNTGSVAVVAEAIARIQRMPVPESLADTLERGQTAKSQVVGILEAYQQAMTAPPAISSVSSPPFQPPARVGKPTPLMQRPAQVLQSPPVFVAAVGNIAPPVPPQSPLAIKVPVAIVSPADIPNLSDADTPPTVPAAPPAEVQATEASETSSTPPQQPEVDEPVILVTEEEFDQRVAERIDRPGTEVTDLDRQLAANVETVVELGDADAQESEEQERTESPQRSPTGTPSKFTSGHISVSPFLANPIDPTLSKFDPNRKAPKTRKDATKASGKPSDEIQVTTSTGTSISVTNQAIEGRLVSFLKEILRNREIADMPFKEDYVSKLIAESTDSLRLFSSANKDVPISSVVEIIDKKLKDWERNGYPNASSMLVLGNFLEKYKQLQLLTRVDENFTVAFSIAFVFTLLNAINRFKDDSIIYEDEADLQSGPHIFMWYLQKLSKRLALFYICKSAGYSGFLFSLQSVFQLVTSHVRELDGEIVLYAKVSVENAADVGDVLAMPALYIDSEKNNNVFGRPTERNAVNHEEDVDFIKKRFGLMKITGRPKGILTSKERDFLVRTADSRKNKNWLQDINSYINNRDDKSYTPEKAKIAVRLIIAWKNAVAHIFAFCFCARLDADTRGRAKTDTTAENILSVLTPDDLGVVGGTGIMIAFPTILQVTKWNSLNLRSLQLVARDMLSVCSVIAQENQDALFKFKDIQVAKGDPKFKQFISKLTLPGDSRRSRRLSMIAEPTITSTTTTEEREREASRSPSPIQAISKMVDRTLRKPSTSAKKPALDTRPPSASGDRPAPKDPATRKLSGPRARDAYDDDQDLTSTSSESVIDTSDSSDSEDASSPRTLRASNARYVPAEHQADPEDDEEFFRYHGDLRHASVSFGDSDDDIFAWDDGTSRSARPLASVESYGDEHSDKILTKYLVELQSLAMEGDPLSPDTVESLHEILRKQGRDDVSIARLARAILEHEREKSSRSSDDEMDA